MPFHHPHHRVRKVNTDKFDSFMSILAVVGPFSMIPQVYQIYQTKNVDGVSLITWLISVATSLVWLAYGFHHKDKPIIFNSAIGAFLCSLVAIGILLYR